VPQQVSAKYRGEKSLSLPTMKPYSFGLYSYVIPIGVRNYIVKYSRTRLKRHRFIRNLACRVRYFAIPINSSLLTNVIFLGYIHARLKRYIIQSDTKKRELLKNPTKIEEIQEKKIIDRVAFCRACNTQRVTQKNGNF
jgi:hypothetical protein